MGNKIWGYVVSFDPSLIGDNEGVVTLKVVKNGDVPLDVYIADVMSRQFGLTSPDNFTFQYWNKNTAIINLDTYLIPSKLFSAVQPGLTPGSMFFVASTCLDDPNGGLWVVAQPPVTYS